MEAAEALVVSRHLALALQDVDLNGGLVVSGGGEDLALLGGDGGVALDELGAHAAQGLNAQGQRRDVQQQHALDVAAENAALNGRADSHALIGVDALEAFLADQGLDQSPELRGYGWSRRPAGPWRYRWAVRPESDRACFTGPTVFSTR